jgi:polyhydroxybutyrate depolymerase
MFLFKQKIYLIIFIYLISCSSGLDVSNEDIQNNMNFNQIYNLNCIPYGTNTQKCNLEHKNLDRYYLIYKPLSVLNESNTPLLFSLHGYGSSAEFHKSYTGYESLSQQEKFIVIYPQGYKLETTLANSSSHWNSGAWTVGSNVDDVDFIKTIIEIISDQYSIDQNRIYSTGMSNGGFMSYHLACKLSHKIAAIASVTGSMSKQTFDSCNPSHPTSVLQIHGLSDFVVPYNGNNAVGMMPIDEVLDFWATFNACSPNPVAVIDYFNEKGSVEFVQYDSCLNNVEVNLLRLPNMNHTWPSLNNYNISATKEIWNFLSRFDINGKIN